MLNILAAVLLFGFIVLVHEFGHFLLAKCSGIGVVEFSVGMGPRIFSVEKGETRYSIKALPFGGSCMMVGEDAENPDPKALTISRCYPALRSLRQDLYSTLSWHFCLPCSLWRRSATTRRY